jgi:hypothetical protein
MTISSYTIARQLEESLQRSSDRETLEEAYAIAGKPWYEREAREVREPFHVRMARHSQMKKSALRRELIELGKRRTQGAA